MTVQEKDIRAAMAGKLDERELRLVTGVLCGDPSKRAGISVIDDSTLCEPDDGHPEGPRMLGPCLPAERAVPDMIELPATLFEGVWLRRSLRSRADPAGANAFLAGVRRISPAAAEPAYLVMVLRETYGTNGLAELADEAVFSQPAYAPFRDMLLPLLKEYAYS